MAVSEQIANQVMKTVTSIDNNTSSTVDVSLADFLAGHPKTLEYILIVREYSLAVMKSWIESINEGNWKHVSITEDITLHC